MIALAAAAAENEAPTLPPTLRRLVLTGFMGSGKTTVGRLLAESLGWEFLDLDAHLEARAGASIPELFERHGEPRFRRLESAALASALSRSNVVIALGGGTPEQLTNRLLLEQTPGTTSIFLDAPFPVLYDRCMLQTLANPAHQRPVLSSPEAGEARFHTRQPIYRRMARITCDAAGLTPDQAAAFILETLGTRI